VLETRRCYIEEWDALEILSLIPAPNRLVFWLRKISCQTSPSAVALLGCPLSCVLEVLRHVQAWLICSACSAPTAKHLTHFFNLIGCLSHRTGIFADLIQVLLNLWCWVFPLNYRHAKSLLMSSNLSVGTSPKSHFFALVTGISKATFRLLQFALSVYKSWK
jgi:hypothetical protein